MRGAHSFLEQVLHKRRREHNLSTYETQAIGLASTSSSLTSLGRLLRRTLLPAVAGVLGGAPDTFRACAPLGRFCTRQAGAG
jgi:hypothetical protein